MQPPWLPEEIRLYHSSARSNCNQCTHIWHLQNPNKEMRLGSFYWQRRARPALSMMTSSNGNVFRVTGPLCGEFTGLRWIPLTMASYAELWCFLSYVLNKRLCKQSWGWWFETPSRSFWRPCDEFMLWCIIRVCLQRWLDCTTFEGRAWMNNHIHRESSM